MIDITQKQLQALADAGNWIQEKGWCPATSGNLSVRLNSGTAEFAISVSGKYKGELHVDDFIPVDNAGKTVGDSRKPSAETLLHGAIYSHYANANAVLHSHSVFDTVMSLAASDDVLTLTGYEIQKALSGVDTHQASIEIPILENSQDMNALQQQVQGVLSAQAQKQQPCWGFLLAGHGLYTWGDSVAEAKRHLEALEYLLECEYRLRALTLS